MQRLGLSRHVFDCCPFPYQASLAATAVRMCQPAVAKRKGSHMTINLLPDCQNVKSMPDWARVTVPEVTVLTHPIEILTRAQCGVKAETV